MATTKRRETGGKTALSMTVLRAFSVDHASRVTGLTKSRLTRWDSLGFFSPEYLDDDDRGNPYARVYSYTDLVGLRTLKVLADDYRVPLSELRKAADMLAARSDTPWANIPLAVLNRQVVTDIDTYPVNVTDGQAVMKHIPLPSIASEVARNAEALRHRSSDQFGKTEQHRYTAHNALVISGTRIPVSAVEEYIEAGYDAAGIISEYPGLVAKDITTVRSRMKKAA